MLNDNAEKHLIIYMDRCELHQNDEVSVYHQGPQNEAARHRYEVINQQLKAGYLDRMMASVPSRNFLELSEESKRLLRNMVYGITSEVGRSLVGLTCLQLAIKAIVPEQSIRLHKGSGSWNNFSWVEGISMRTLDRNYNTPFLRKHGLLNVNRDGIFMTRSLAENYPYSMLYKAEMKGPFKQWLSLVDAIESNSLPPEAALCYLLALLKNHSDRFKINADRLCMLANRSKRKTFEEIHEIITRFFNTTVHSARAFEVSLHCLYQAMGELDLLGDAKLAPLAQMRSANKKHGNIGDVELIENGTISAAWDAKYGKPYLSDELGELRDKLETHPDVKVAGFVCNVAIDKRDDILGSKNVLEAETGTKIHLFSFDEWVAYETDELSDGQKCELARRWLVAIAESLSQRRRNIAPIDEPCDQWIADLANLIENADREN